MAHVILKKMRRYTTRGHTFERGKVHPIDPAIALSIENDPVQSERFKVHLTLQERNDLANGVSKQDQEFEDEEHDNNDTGRSGGGAEPTHAQRLEQIRDAIDQLDVDNEEHFTKGGKPDARALSSILGWNVTSAMRDEAIGPHPVEKDPQAGKVEPAAEGASSRRTGQVRISRGGTPAKPAEKAPEGNGEEGQEGEESEEESEEPTVEV